MMRIPSLAHICPNWVTAASPRNRSCTLGRRTYTFFQSVYKARGGHLPSVFFLQVFRRQRRPEVRITPAYLNEHRLAKLLGVSSVGDSPAVAMLQRFRTPTAIARPHPLGLPIAQPQQLRRLLQPQAARLYPPHDLDTTQLFAAQSTSPQSECLLSKAL